MLFSFHAPHFHFGETQAHVDHKNGQSPSWILSCSPFVFSVKVMCVDLGNLICVSGAFPTVLFIDDTVPTTYKCISYIPPTVLQRMGPPYSMKKPSMRFFICQTSRFSQSPSLREPHQFKRCGMHNKRKWKIITMRRQRGYICALDYFA